MGSLGHSLLEQFQPLAGELGCHVSDSGVVPAGVRETGDKPIRESAGTLRHYDEDRRSCFLRRADRRPILGCDEVDWEVDEFSGETRKPIGVLIGITSLDGDVLALKMAEVA
jgi:hypothetical protein